jgi:Histidine kinase-like ATPase domain
MTPQRASWISSADTCDAHGEGLAVAVREALSPAAVLPLSLVRRECPEHERAGVAAFAACTLGCDPQPVRAARRFTGSTLPGWGMAGLVDDVGVVVSEMVTNALRYGLSALRGRPISPQSVWLGMLRQGSTVMCVVFDPSTNVPVFRTPGDHMAESGRGLHVVESLSDAWGWTPPVRTGKAVWAMFSASRRHRPG